MDELRAALAGWLDPQLVGALVLDWSGRIVAALAIFLIGRLIATFMTGWFGRAVQRVGMDQTLARFFGSLIYIVLIVMVVLTAVTVLGVPTTNFLAIVGAAGLAVGLALKDSLSNFSSGVMLVFFRPFQVGDTIQAAGVTGIVESIGMFSTVVKTPDNAVITVPNSLVYGGTITNFTAESTRRVDLLVAISYDTSIGDAKKVLRELVRADGRFFEKPSPEIVVNELGQNAVTMAVRAWVATADHGNARANLLERIKEAFEEQGFSIPYPQMRLERRLDRHLDQTAGAE
jgi:small conductance mechanosensitive channel